MKRILSSAIIIFLTICILTYATDGDPTPFGNSTTDTACIGGSNGIVNLTGTAYANEFSGPLNWSYLQNYPAACSAGKYVTTIGDTLTCDTPTDTTYTAEEDLIYLDGTEFKSNETILNESIEAFGYSTTVGTVTSVTGASPITSTGGATPEIGITVAKDIVTTAPLTGGTDNILVGADGDITIAIPVATTDADGYLSKENWDTFNGKQSGDAALTSISGLAYVSDSFIKLTAEDTYTVRTLTETVSDLGLVIGTNVQAYDAILSATTASFLVAQENKLGNITVTQAVDLDTMESNVATNNAKNTNVPTELSTGTVTETS